MLTFEEWRHTYADVFATDDAARAAWTAASNKGYSAGVQDTRELLAAHNAGAQEPVAWRVRGTHKSGLHFLHLYTDKATAEKRTAAVARRVLTPLYAHPQPMPLPDAARDAISLLHETVGITPSYGWVARRDALLKRIAEIECSAEAQANVYDQDNPVTQAINRRILAYAVPPQPITDAARELIEAAKDVLANGHQHDVGGGDAFIGTCDSTERLQRALAEIERLDRAKGE